MTMHVKIAGVWKEIAPAHVKVAGVWKEITEGWVKVAGVWKQFYQHILVNITGGTATAFAISPNDATASWRMNSNGLEERGTANGGATTFVTIGTWLLAGVAADYECMMSMDSGDTFTGNSLDVWLACDTVRLWSLIESGLSTKSGTGTLSIRRASDSLLLDTASVTLNATVEP